MTLRSRESLFSPPHQSGSATARQDDAEEHLHHGLLAGHQVADGHFLTQRLPGHSLQELPQNLCRSWLSVRKPEPRALIGMEEKNIESVIIFH